MKKSLAHLLERKRGELARIVSIIRQSAPQAEMITPQELKYLARCVELLQEQVETSCETKMTSFV